MRNPILNRAVFILSLLGIFIAGFLWNMHSHAADIPCDGSGGCMAVATSRYSRFPFGSGPPVAAYGFFGYSALAILAFLRTMNEPAGRDRLLLALMVLASAFASAASLGLTGLEAFVIHAFCRWCLGSQIVILVIYALSLADWRLSSYCFRSRSRLKGISSV